jgi:ferredoxin
MISALLILLIISIKSKAFRMIGFEKYTIRHHKFFASEEQSFEAETIRVRFINTATGKDVVVENVPAGSNLLAVGDNAGVRLPRACRTGLCGSCTCDLKDPAAIATKTNPREGFATIRACSTKCFVPEGLEEMVIDVHRMSRKAKPTSIIGRDSTISIEDLTKVGL